MFSFPSEKRERERERERERDRETYELASVSLSFFLPYTYVVFFTLRFGEMCILSFWREFFFFFLARATLVLNFEWTKGTECFHCRALSCFLFGLRLELSSHFKSSKETWWTKRYLITPQTNGQSNIRIHHRIFLYRFFFCSLLHLTSIRSQKKI